MRKGEEYGTIIAILSRIIGIDNSNIYGSFSNQQCPNRDSRNYRGDYHGIEWFQPDFFDARSDFFV